jgi:hypothetical protein
LVDRNNSGSSSHRQTTEQRKVAESIEVLLCPDGNVIVGMKVDTGCDGDVTTMMGLM